MKITRNIFQLLVLFFASFSVYASVPKEEVWIYYSNTPADGSTDIGPICSEKVLEGGGTFVSIVGEGRDKQCMYMSSLGYGPFPMSIQRTVVKRCPAGTVENAQGTCDPPPGECVAPLVKDAGGKCSCPAGTKEETDANGLRQCKPDSVCSEMVPASAHIPVI